MNANKIPQQISRDADARHAAALPSYLQKSAEGWYLSLKIQPGAKKTEIREEADGWLRIRLAAPAVENKANTALLEFIAALLQIKRNKPVLVSGDKSRLKKIFIPADANPVFEALFSA